MGKSPISISFDLKESKLFSDCFTKSNYCAIYRIRNRSYKCVKRKGNRIRLQFKSYTGDIRFAEELLKRIGRQDE